MESGRLFRCVLASLYEYLSVRPSVCILMPVLACFILYSLSGICKELSCLSRLIAVVVVVVVVIVVDS